MRPWRKWAYHIINILISRYSIKKIVIRRCFSRMLSLSWWTGLCHLILNLSTVYNRFINFLLSWVIMQLTTLCLESFLQCISIHDRENYFFKIPCSQVTSPALIAASKYLISLSSLSAARNIDIETRRSMTPMDPLCFILSIHHWYIAIRLLIRKHAFYRGHKYCF